MKPLLETLTAGAGYLEKRGVEEARLNMEHLLAHVLGCRRLDLYLRFSEVIPEEFLVKLRDLTRRSKKSGSRAEMACVFAVFCAPDIPNLLKCRPLEADADGGGARCAAGELG
jgi:hypothetical protein